MAGKTDRTSKTAANTTERPDLTGCIQVATWNVNSIRMRWEALCTWLHAHRPDVLCLQEIKLQDPDFAKLDFAALGYHGVAHGQKTYNGVAVLCRKEHGPVCDVSHGMNDGDPDTEARLLTAHIPSLNVCVASVYVPNGQAVGTDKYEYKLRWLRRLADWLHRKRTPPQGLLLCGDYNVAPADSDVYDPALWQDTVICHSTARQALAAVMDLGFADTLRQAQPTAQLFTFWDYRGLSFPKNHGLRIDHILASTDWASRCRWAEVDRQARKGDKPSDHAPVIAWFSPAQSIHNSPAG